MTLRACAPPAITDHDESVPSRGRVGGFLKWAGSKRALLPELEPYWPRQFGTYHEPFLGSGAVFFRLAPESARLSDLNPELIAGFTAVRDDVDGVICELKRLPYNRAVYDRVRALDPTLLGSTERGARMIYLNRTCFNGLYRENRRGQFNVPFGRYVNPVICDELTLRDCSRRLRGVEIKHLSAWAALEKVQAGDFCYLDPPYLPISKTASFTAYTRGSFGMFEQELLASWCQTLNKIGAKFMLSNSSTETTRELYKSFEIRVIQARRMISSKGSTRGAVEEIVVTNY